MKEAVKRKTEDKFDKQKGRKRCAECKLHRRRVVWNVLLSVCCFYWLMNKDLAWPIAWEEKGGVGETQWRQMC